MILVGKNIAIPGSSKNKNLSKTITIKALESEEIGYYDLTKVIIIEHKQNYGKLAKWKLSQEQIIEVAKAIAANANEDIKDATYKLEKGGWP